MRRIPGAFGSLAVQRLLVSIFCFWLLAACSDAPTPLPIDIPPTATQTPLPGTTPQPIQVFIDPRLRDAIPEADRAQIENAASIVVPDAPPDVFDVYVSIDAGADMQPAPSEYQIALAVNTRLSPFDQADIPSLQALLDESANRVEQRQQIASSGYPDGFSLSMYAVNVPEFVLDDIRAALEQVNMNAQIARTSLQAARNSFSTIHAVIFSWGDQAIYDEWATLSENNLLTLTSFTLSYAASPTIEIVGFTPAGFPIPRQR